MTVRPSPIPTGTGPLPVTPELPVCPGSASGRAAATELIQLHRLLTTRIDRFLRPHRLTLARFEILRVLGFSSQQKMTVTRLGRALQVHSTSVTSAVDLLEADAYIRRETSTEDRREVLVCLTALGRETVEQATDVLNREVFSTLGLDEKQFKVLWSVLRSMRANFGDFAATTDPVAAVERRSAS